MTPTSEFVRIGAVAGIVSALLFLVGFALPGRPPSPDAATSAIASYLADNRTAVLAGDLVIGIAAAAFACFLAGLRIHLRMRDDGLATAAVLAGILATALIVAGAALQAGLALNSEELNDDTIRLSFDSYNALITIAGAPLAAAVAAAAAAGVGDIADRLRGLLALPGEERRAPGRAAREVAVERWSWATVARRLLEPFQT